MSQIKKVGVLGCGLMGRGIAQVAASTGHTTVVRDVTDEFNAKGKAAIEKSLAKFVEKEKMSAKDRDATLARLTFTTAVADLKDCDIVVEAITEDLELKNALWKELDDLCPDHTIFASNTSSLTIAAMAAVTKRANQFVGLHFFNPVPLMKLVEVVRGLQTSDETVERTVALAESVGKKPICCNDHPGFVSNRVLMPMINEAIFCLQDGVAEPDAIDGIMTLGMNHPMGPLALADLIGLDVCLFILEVLHRDLGEDRYRPCPMLRKFVQAGRLGRKSKHGFFRYE